MKDFKQFNKTTIREFLNENKKHSLVNLTHKFAHIYNIKYNGEIIGSIELPDDLDGDTISIGDVSIKDEYRGKLLGVETYKAAILMFEKPIESFMATDEAKRVWDSLVRQGLAKKTEYGYISIK